MKHGFLPAAQQEYLEAVSFYEERQKGLGAALVAEVDRAVRLACERPEAWRLVHSSGIRRIVLSRFPYVLFYRVSGEVLQVTALAHERKRPGYWMQRPG